jgi:hypothetical protein
MVDLHLEKLNKLMRLDGVKKKVTHFHPKHLWFLNLEEYQKKYFKDIPGYEKYLEKNIINNAAYTGYYDTKPVVCFGLLNMFPGVAEAWLIPGKELKQFKIALPFHRATKVFFDCAFDLFDLRRIQVSVDSNNLTALKWIEKLLFIREGIMKSFGPDGNDYIMLSKLNGKGE